MTNTDIVRACLESYLAQDREAAERLIADDYVFSSPQDDRIDRAAFFERCFPTAHRFRTQEILHLVPAGSDDVFVRVPADDRRALPQRRGEHRPGRQHQ
ncbi:nuclear transport factor 2 family protein [Streptomyces meridianus]|uniref:Nuclear transport factor 2 family protein n=1 Tax=Streptomyces meridianus TaxID=2938945 RepID=A0ABT0XAV9_9ACTN|nr:nuclear transport factor 2 family protein [Streptomyces meridianus]MCM2578944.1 nuclear transport factor 2 family protein [Streptomyces meridianus]